MEETPNTNPAKSSISFEKRTIKLVVFVVAINSVERLKQASLVTEISDLRVLECATKFCIHGSQTYAKRLVACQRIAVVHNEF